MCRIKIHGIKRWLARIHFSVFASANVMVYFLCGLAFTSVSYTLRRSEHWTFSCSFDDKSSATYQKQVLLACFLEYDLAFNSPVPFYSFVLLSYGSSIFISIVYAVMVHKLVEEVPDGLISGALANRRLNERHNRTVYNFYVVHLALRALVGITFTGLQYTYFYPNGFDKDFSCRLSLRERTTFKIHTPKNGTRIFHNTLVPCMNPTASRKAILGISVIVVNCIAVFVILAEMIYPLYRHLIIRINGNSEGNWVVRLCSTNRNHSDPKKKDECRSTTEIIQIQDPRNSINIRQSISTKQNSIQDSKDHEDSKIEAYHPPDSKTHPVQLNTI